MPIMTGACVPLKISLVTAIIRISFHILQACPIRSGKHISNLTQAHIILVGHEITNDIQIMLVIFGVTHVPTAFK